MPALPKVARYERIRHSPGKANAAFGLLERKDGNGQCQRSQSEENGSQDDGGRLARMADDFHSSSLLDLRRAMPQAFRSLADNSLAESGNDAMLRTSSRKHQFHFP